MLEVTWELACQRPAVWEFRVDGDPWKRIHRCVLGKRLEFSHKYPSIEAWEQAFRLVEEKQARLYAYRCLAKRSYSRMELERLLGQKGVCPKISASLLAELQERGWVASDEDWLDAFIASQVRRALGPQKIVQKLMQKGVPYPQARELVDSYFLTIDQEALVASCVEKMRGLDPKNPKDLLKIKKKLLSKGFYTSSLYFSSI